MKNYLDNDLRYDEPRKVVIVFDDEEMERAFIECIISGYNYIAHLAEMLPDYNDDVIRLEKIFKVDLGFKEVNDL